VVLWRRRFQIGAGVAACRDRMWPGRRGGRRCWALAPHRRDRQPSRLDPRAVDPQRSSAGASRPGPAPTTRTSRGARPRRRALICAPVPGAGLTQLSPCSGHRPYPRRPCAPADAGASACGWLGDGEGRPDSATGLQAQPIRLVWIKGRSYDRGVGWRILARPAPPRLQPINVPADRQPGGEQESWRSSLSGRRVAVVGAAGYSRRRPRRQRRSPGPIRRR
jgi:hypothetical protein